MKYHDQKTTCRRGDTIATSRLGTCRVITTHKHHAFVRNVMTKERFDMCEIGISDSDLIERKRATQTT